MNDVQRNLHAQLKSFGIRGLGICLWDSYSIKINRNETGAIIRYNGITDTYTVTYYQGQEVSEPVHDVFVGDLGTVIARVRRANFRGYFRARS